MVELSIALCCASIAALVPEIRLPKIQNYAGCLAEKDVKNMDFWSQHKWLTVGLVIVGSVSAFSSAREGLHSRRECWISVHMSTSSKAWLP